MQLIRHPSTKIALAVCVYDVWGGDLRLSQEPDLIIFVLGKDLITYRRHTLAFQ